MRPVNIYRSFFLSGIMMLAFSWVNAQTLKDVFSNSESPVFYYGIDFTKAKLIDEASANTQDIRDRLYTSINELIVNEPKKYDLNGAFHKSNIDHDLSHVNKRNTKVNTEEIVSSNTSDFSRLEEKDINALIKGFATGDQKGVGLLFVVEGMSKSKKAMAVWVTLFDIKSKKVLMTERLEGETKGIGFRNYWASGIKSVIDMVDKKKYKEWKSKYAGY